MNECRCTLYIVIDNDLTSQLLICKPFGISSMFGFGDKGTLLLANWHDIVMDFIVHLKLCCAEKPSSDSHRCKSDGASWVMGITNQRDSGSLVEWNSRDFQYRGVLIAHGIIVKICIHVYGQLQNQPNDNNSVHTCTLPTQINDTHTHTAPCAAIKC